MKNKLERNGHGLIYNSILIFVWRGCRKPQKPSARATGILAKTETWEL
jgi:hypothetical protein